MKNTKPYKVVVNYSYEGYSGHDHNDSTYFNVDAINYSSAIKKAKKLFKKYCSYGDITSIFITDRTG
jgi:hypothetical protein